MKFEINNSILRIDKLSLIYSLKHSFYMQTSAAKAAGKLIFIAFGALYFFMHSPPLHIIE